MFHVVCSIFKKVVEEEQKFRKGEKYFQIDRTKYVWPFYNIMHVRVKANSGNSGLLIN